MKALVFSDSHGYYNRILNIVNKTNDIDTVIHCGDIANDCTSLEQLFKVSKPNIKFYYVCGNNDFSNDIPKELSLEINGKKVYITHGHLLGVKSSKDKLHNKIKEGYDLVLYGHTHIPDTEYFGGGIILNPGAMCSASKATYALVAIENNKINTQMFLF